MQLCTVTFTLLFVLDFYKVATQLPPRLNIPGAVLLPQSKPFRPRVHNNDLGPPPRLRRPIPNAVPASIRPVVEEPEDNLPPSPPPLPSSQTIDNSFDDEVSKLGISALQSAVRQAVDNDDDVPSAIQSTTPQPRPVQFRPERPVPLLRQDIRDLPRPVPQQRQQVRVAAVRQPSPQPPQQFRQATRVSPAPARQQQFVDQDDERQTTRRRKPVVQILSKYRNDNPDGSITWGYENEDGTFKEETLGNDCVTRGKYGYIDPDGVRREYKYETGNKCDEQEEPEGDVLVQAKQPPQNRKQQQQQQQQQQQPQQYRPLQY